MAKVEAAIHVGIREGGHELGLSGLAGVDLKDLLILPVLLNRGFIRKELVSLVPADGLQERKKKTKRRRKKPQQEKGKKKK